MIWLLPWEWNWYNGMNTEKSSSGTMTVYDLYLHHQDNIYCCPYYSTPFVLRFLSVPVSSESLAFSLFQCCIFNFRLHRLQGPLGLALLLYCSSEWNPEFSTMTSRIITLITAATLLNVMMKAVMMKVRLHWCQLPHPFSALNHDCPFSWWDQIAGFHCTDAPHLPCPPFFLPALLQRAGSGQGNLQGLCLVCAWSNQNYHRQEDFQPSLIYWHLYDEFKLPDNTILSSLGFADAYNLLKATALLV